MRLEIYNSITKVYSIRFTINHLLYKELAYPSQKATSEYYHLLKNVKTINKILKNTKIDDDKRKRTEKWKTTNQLKINNIIPQLKVRLYNKDKKEFPTGLLPRVINLLDKKGIEYELIDKRQKPQIGLYRFVLREPFPKLRYYQKDAVRAIVEGSIDSGKYKGFDMSGRGIINAVMSSGKSLMCCKMIWDLGVKSIVVTPSKPITDHMYDTLIKYFGKGKVAKLDTKSVKTKPINVVNIQALIKLDPKLLRDVSACYIDEFHRAASETYREANLNHLKNCYYRVGLTATAFRSDGSDMGLESVLSTIVFKYDYNQAQKDNFLVKPDFEIISIELKTHDTYQQEYDHEIVRNKKRNKLIRDCTLYHKNDNIIILVKRIEHGDTLKKIIPDSFFLNGKEKDSVRTKVMTDFRSGKLKCLIGINTILGEGIDLPIANLLIMAGGGKSKGQTMQNLGRVLRLYPGKTEAVIYDFSDHGSRYLSEHSLIRQEIYKTYK
jgi:DNA repair protein RadD